MLFVFNLDWKRFSIGNLVVEGNSYLEQLSENLKVSERVIFNCASMGAGEFLLGATNKQNDDIPSETLNYMRWHHLKVLESIRESIPFVANRDVTKMLQTLKNGGHSLAVVGTSRTDNLEETLKDTRTREWFGTNVFGYDRLLDRLKGSFTLAALYSTAIDTIDIDYEEALIVSDDATAIQDAVPIQARAVVGYLDPYVDWDEQTIRLKEMKMAGANYMAVGGHTVTNLPWYITGRSEYQAKQGIQHVMRRDRHLQM